MKKISTSLSLRFRTIVAVIILTCVGALVTSPLWIPMVFWGSLSVTSPDLKVRLSFLIDPGDVEYLENLVLMFARREGFDVAGILHDAVEQDVIVPVGMVAMRIVQDNAIISIHGNSEVGQITVYIYEPTPNPHFSDIALRFEGEIRSQWPMMSKFEH